MAENETISCLILDDEPVAREIIATHLGKIPSIKIEASCSNAIEAFHVLRSHKIDLVFLDINMPEVSGIAFGKID